MLQQSEKYILYPLCTWKSSILMDRITLSIWTAQYSERIIFFNQRLGSWIWSKILVICQKRMFWINLRREVFFYLNVFLSDMNQVFSRITCIDNCVWIQVQVYVDSLICLHFPNLQLHFRSLNSKLGIYSAYDSTVPMNVLYISIRTLLSAWNFALDCEWLCLTVSKIVHCTGT